MGGEKQSFTLNKTKGPVGPFVIFNYIQPFSL